MKKINLEKMKYIDFSKFDEKNLDVKFTSPYHDWQFSKEEKNKLSVFNEMSDIEWKNRLSRGQFVSLKDLNINYDDLNDSYRDIRECQPWRLIRISEFLDRSDTITAPLLYKSENTYTMIDGRTTTAIFNYFKKISNLKFWLIDDSVDSTDYTRALDITVQEKIDAEKEAQGNFTRLFDYGNIDDSHKALVRDITDKLEKAGQHQLATEFRHLVKIEDNEKYNIEESPFFQEAKNFGLSIQKQGFITVSENGKSIEYPMISTGGDIREYNRFMEAIFKKYVIK